MPCSLPCYSARHPNYPGFQDRPLRTPPKSPREDRRPLEVRVVRRIAEGSVW